MVQSMIQKKMMTPRLTASLVLYQSDPAEFEIAIRSFLNAAPDAVLVVSDNSPEPLSSGLFEHPQIIYMHNGANLGFGKAHNRAFAKVAEKSDLHLLLNPDVSFGSKVLQHLASLMADDPEIGAIMPQIRYSDGRLQPLCKLLPTPMDLIFRRFLPESPTLTALNQRYELHGLPQTSRCDIPNLSGCFLLVRSELFASLKGFDERYFMYMEDVDLVRRIGTHARTMYEPAVSVTHLYNKGSYRNRRLLRYHTVSAVRYFNKWGWLLDRERDGRNRKMTTYLAHQTRGGAETGN